MKAAQPLRTDDRAHPPGGHGGQEGGAAFASLPGSRTRPLDRYAMAHDASHYLLVPEAVATPADTADLAAIFAAASGTRTPVTFRSGGTSLSGQSVTDGILVDGRKHFRGITVLDGGQRVRVQPGATVRAVNARLARHGFKLGPDPASEVACTIGGVVANNSSGMACGTEFNTYRTLESLVFVLPSGTTIDTADPEADRHLAERESGLHEGLVRLRRRILDNPESVRKIERQFSMKNTMGYGLNSFLDFERPVDILAHLLVGSEGTLAFVAEATFRTVPVARQVATSLLVFPDLSEATAVLPDLVASGLATVELMDAASLKVAQGLPGTAAQIQDIDVDRHAALLVEFHAQEQEALLSRVEGHAALFADLNLAAPAEFTRDAAVRASLWKVRKGLYTAVAEARPSGTSALLEDVVVPVPRLLDTCESLIDLFARHRYENSVIFGHAKDGNVHFLLGERFDDPASLERYRAFTDDMVDLVLSHEGSLKAEHGTGRIMAPFVRRQYGDELYAVMKEVKRLCDPADLLNPGVVLSDEPLSYMDHLKLAPTVEEEVDRCVECGYCEPACPSKDLTTTPRQRIVLRREIARAEEAGDHALAEQLRGDYEYDGVDTCAVDGMCQVACPVNINTGDLVRRLRAENRGAAEQKVWKGAAENWGTIANVGGKALTLAKILPAPLVSGVTRLGRKVVDPDTLPQYSKDLPGGGTPREPLVNLLPGITAEAVFFQTCIGTMFGPSPTGDGEKGIGAPAAFLRLCERAGVSVAVPDGIQGLCCGTPWKSKGHTDGYQVMLGKVMDWLWEATGQGRLPVVCEASSCSEGLLVMAEKAMASDPKFGSIRIVDSVAFVHDRLLPALTVTARLGSVALHPTCSSTQLGVNGELEALARAFADEVVVPVEWGCCAFAGDRGMLHPELTASATAREAAEVTAVAHDAYASSNRTCEMGLSRATGKPYRHVLELLEEATR